jgi:hypothetical protein
MDEMAVAVRAEGSRNSNDDGRRIDVNDEHPRNALASIRINFDPNSKVNDERDLQSEKHSWQRTAVDAGRAMDFNNEQHENAFPPI